MNLVKNIGEKITLVTLELVFNNKISRKFRLNKANEYLSIVDLNDIKKLNADRFMDVTQQKVFVMQEDLEIENNLRNFVEVMNSNFSEEKLSNLYNNIIWVKVNNNKFIKILGDKGRFKAIDNTITLGNRQDINSLNHELMHLSSAPMDELNPNSGGFYYEFEDGKNIGTAIDEGYTEYMLKKYFDEDKDSPYEIEISIVKEIEDFIGKDKMEELYLKGNFFGLIKILSNYFDLSKIERFITSTDFVFNYRNKYYLTREEEEILYSQYEEMLIFLLEIYCTKLKESNNIDEASIKEHFSDLLYGIGWNFMMDENTESEIYKTMNNVLGINIDLSDILEQYKLKSMNL